MVAFTLKSTYPTIAVESMVQQSPKSVISAKPEGHAVARGENPANAGFPLRGCALLPQCSSKYVKSTLFWSTELEIDVLKLQVPAEVNVYIMYHKMWKRYGSLFGYHDLQISTVMVCFPQTFRSKICWGYGNMNGLLLISSRYSKRAGWRFHMS